MELLGSGKKLPSELRGSKPAISGSLGLRNPIQELFGSDTASLGALGLKISDSGSSEAQKHQFRELLGSQTLILGDFGLRNSTLGSFGIEKHQFGEHLAQIHSFRELWASENSI